MPYGQEGRQAVVYQLVAPDGEKRALKVFKPQYRVPSLVSQADRLATFAGLPGLSVCQRTVLSARRHIDLLRQHPELTYAVLMPWIEGPTWMQVMIEKRQLSPQQSLLLARALLDILSGMEERGVAHCDLSGSNLLLPALTQPRDLRSQTPVALVDVEQLFGPGLERPPFLPGGSAGYAHPTASGGLWQLEADRFAGAVLIAEMLGWCDPDIREAAWGESYFDPTDMQQDSRRCRMMMDVLRRRWGTGVRNLFERAWTSELLAQCPTFGEWLVALPQDVLADTAGPTRTRTDEFDVQVLLDVAEKLAGQGNSDAALVVFRQAYALTPTTSALRLEVERRMRELQVQASAITSPARDNGHTCATARASPPSTYGQAGPPASPEPLPIRRWQPPSIGPSRTTVLLSLLASFGAIGILLFLLIYVQRASLANLGVQIQRSFGVSVYQAVGTSFLAALIGLVEVVIFRQRMRSSQRWLYILATAMGGAIGGATGQRLASGLLLHLWTVEAWFYAGLLMGAVSGVIAGLAQTRLMRARGCEIRWTLWRTATWAVIWSVGMMVTAIRGDTNGMATAAGSIVIVSGVALWLFLHVSPEIEF